jgi:hypothetical protein
VSAVATGAAVAAVVVVFAGVLKLMPASRRKLSAAFSSPASIKQHTTETAHGIVSHQYVCGCSNGQLHWLTNIGNTLRSILPVAMEAAVLLHNVACCVSCALLILLAAAEAAVVVYRELVLSTNVLALPMAYRQPQ